MSKKARNAKYNMKHVNVRSRFDGDILRKIPLNRNRSCFALAVKLNEIGETDLTVFTSIGGRRAGQVLSGKVNHSCLTGYYTGDLSCVFSRQRENELSQGII